MTTEGMRTDELLKWAVIAGGVYLVWRAVSGLTSAASSAASAVGSAVSTAEKAVSSGYQSAVNAVASGLYAVFGPDDAKAMGSMTYLMVTFPDGNRHAVPGNTVSQNGAFVWTGYPPGSQPAVNLQLVKDSSGAWFATTPAPSTDTTTWEEPTDFGV